ncbi:MAG: Lrp/AsnC family transcriptional regulator [Verrucomicrobiota bacterium]
MARQLEASDTRILDLIQTEVPLDPQPFQVIGERVGLPESEVIQRIAALKTPPPIIRQISAIFDSKSLGYHSTLVAAMVDESHLDQAVAVINQHPGVSHNYRRNNAFNLWYTLAVPPHSILGLEKTLAILHRLSGAKSTRLLPTLRLFKIGVKLDLSGSADLATRSDKPAFSAEDQEAAAGIPVTETDKRMIRVMQRNLPIVSRPFDSWASEAGVSVSELLAAARQYITEKRMRRFSAVLKHREMGFSANGMGVWDVPVEQREAFGRVAASFSAVSHCYERPSYPDWPFSIFTMVHAPTQDQCDGVLKAISEATGITRYGALYSSKEYKKVRVQYFAGDIEAWETAHQQDAVAS